MSETAPGYTADGVEFVGYHDVGGKPIFKLAMQVVGDRWYLYASHFWEPRLSIFDVSEPAEPRLVNAIEGPEPASGDLLMRDGSEAGEMRSSRDGIGLALLRLEAVAAEQPLSAGEARITPIRPALVRALRRSSD